MGRKTFSLQIKAFSLLLLFLPPLPSWAQLETETATLSPTPKLAITGTPFISTVWLGATNDPLQVSPTPSTSREIDISDMATAHEEAMPTPTPASMPNTLFSTKTNGYGPSSGSSNPVSLKKGSNTPGYHGDEKLTMLDLYRAGIENYKAKNYDQALIYLKEAIDVKDPAVPIFYYAEANAMIGVIYKFDRPDATQARSYCEAALRIDPTTATAEKLIHEIDFNTTETEKVYWMGIKSYEKNNYREAIILLKQVVETKDPTTPSFYFAEAAKTLGIIYQFYQKDSDLAQKYYGIALRIEPKDEVAKGNLAKLQK